MPPPRLITGTIAQLEDALASAVSSARASDPLAPVTVLIGHVLLRPYLRRALALRGVAQVNVRYLRPYELAMELSQHDASLRALPRLTPAAERLLVRDVAGSASGYFGKIANRDGFVEALGRLFRELELGGFTADADFGSPAGRGASPKLQALATLYGEYGRRRAGFATVGRHYAAAMTAPFEGPLIVHGVWSPSRLQMQLIERIASQAPLTVLLPRSGTDADATHAALRARLAELGCTVEETPPTGVPAVPPNGQLPLTDAPSTQSAVATPLDRIGARLFAAHAGERIETDRVALINAPDTVREVWEAARACLRWAEDGIRFHEMAVAYRNRDPYRALVDEIFTEAGIETYLHDGRLLSTHPLGRRVLALIELAREGAFSRAKVMEFLTETELPRATADQYDRVRPSEWETYTREAGVVQGIEQWRERLTRLANEKRERAKDERFDWMADVATRVETLIRFAEDFHAAVSSRSDEATWAEHIDFLRSLVERYAAGTQPIIDALDELRLLSAVRERATFDEFARAVRDDLESRDTTNVLKEPVRMFGRQGVAVIDASSLRHMRFRAVYMLGVAERAWPPPPRPDPLLLEHERRSINAAATGASLPLRTEPDEAPLGFSTGVQAAKEHLVVSFARADAGRTGKHLPSYFYRGVAETIEGRRLALDELDALANVRRYAAGRLASDDIAASLSRAEYDRGLVKAANEGVAGIIEALSSPALTPAFGRAVQSRRARRGAALSAYDGSMISVDAIAAAAANSVFRRDGASVSASRLEMYATCPYRYFMRYSLGIEPVEEPEDIERIDHLQRGSLIHEILQKFLSEIVPGDPPSNEARDRHLALLMKIAHEEGEERVHRGVTGRPLIWKMDKKAIDEDLVRWYDEELKDAASTGMVPGAFEARFGPGGWGFGPEDETLSSDEPLAITVDGPTVYVQGRIDRIDWMREGGRFRVIDYKTGKKNARDKDTFAAGTMLQLPIYLRAAARMLGRSETDGEAQYFYVSSRGNFKRHVVSGAELDASQADFERILETIADGVDGGYFAPNPEGPDKRNNCMWCDYKDVCDAQIARIMVNKAGDARSTAFIALRDIE
jgi:RecB family exonuclease